MELSVHKRARCPFWSHSLAIKMCSANEVLKWKHPQMPALNWSSAAGNSVPFLPSSPKYPGCCSLVLRALSKYSPSPGFAALCILCTGRTRPGWDQQLKQQAGRCRTTLPIEAYTPRCSSISGSAACLSFATQLNENRGDIARGELDRLLS